MNNELVSVIMSTYNEPMEWLDKAIISILEQSYKELEFIIVCDNPTNKILCERLNYYRDKDKRIKLVYNKENIGLTKSLNKALELASGKYIARMDSDDIANIDRIKEQMLYLKENSLDLVGSGVSCIAENEEVITKLNNFPEEAKKVSKKILYNNCLPHPTWLGKKEVFDNLDGYRNINYAEDYDFLLRAVFSGYKLGNIKKVLLDYRMRESSISNQNGLKQFVTSQVLTNTFRSKELLDYNIVSIKISKALKELSNIDQEKYTLASKMFSEGIQNFNIVKIYKAFMNSKYYRKKMICYIKAFV